jgi:hypothetical protein
MLGIAAAISLNLAGPVIRALRGHGVVGVVLIDEYVGTEVAVECPGVVKRSAHDVARRGHRLGLVFEFKCRGDRRRRLLLWVVESPAGSGGSGRDRLHGSAS